MFLTGAGRRMSLTSRPARDTTSRDSCRTRVHASAMETVIEPTFERERPRMVVGPHDPVSRVAATLLVLLVVTIAGAVTLAGPAVFEGAIERQLAFSLVLAASFAVVGYLVARHDPGNRLAVVTTAMAFGFGLGVVLERYTFLGVERGWPGQAWMLWVGHWVWIPAILAIPTLLPLRFPTGSLPSPRWRPVEVLAVSGIGLATLGVALSAYGVVDFAPAVPLDNPVAVPAGPVVHRLGLAMTVVAAALILAGFVRRLHRARGTERGQLLWAVAGVTGAVGFVAASIAMGAGGAPLSLIGGALLPTSIAIAIVRHGLWDVRLVLSRSLLYGSLTLAVLAVYVATVTALGGILGRTVGAPLVATVIVAVGVDPVRRRVQRFSNRLVYGDREDPYAALTRLAAHLDSAGDRTSLLTEAAATVVRALRLRGAAISVDERELARVGDTEPPDVELPLRARGEEVGVLRIALRPGVELTGADRRLLVDLARHVSATVRAEHLQAEVEASRARLVGAREEERRRIRRDLHDGLGPTLAAIGLDVELVGVDLAAGEPVTADRLDQLAARLRRTVREIRTLVEGLRPAALDELGLRGAVTQLIRDLGGGPTAITLTCDGDLDELPAALDLAAYRIVSEAITNVVRHADARRCRVTLRRQGWQLVLTVEDDGRGIACDAPTGVGRASMAERAEELGGSLTVTSSPRDGTRVEATLPVGAP
jgi:two-component system, NarL family, sensor kinase